MIMAKYKTIEDFKNQIPEGATHYVNEDCSNNFAFFKLVDGEVEIAVPRHNQAWIKADYDSLDEIENLIALTPVQQQEWNGEGYPPVGVKCKFVFNNGQVKVRKPLYIGSQLVVYSDEIGNERSVSISLVKFRPLETPEQKKEREGLEAAYDLYKTIVDGEPLAYSFEQFRSSPSITGYLKAVRKYMPKD